MWITNSVEKLGTQSGPRSWDLCSLHQRLLLTWSRCILHTVYLYVGFVLAFVPLLHFPQVRKLWKTQLTDYPRKRKSLCFHRERLPYPTRWYLACLLYCFTSHHLTQFRFSLLKLETTLQILGEPPLPSSLFSPPPFQKRIGQNRGNN